MITYILCLKGLCIPQGRRGFTLIEMMIAMGIAGLLAAIAVPNYISYRQRALNASVITEIRILEKRIANYVVDNGQLPSDLSDLGGAVPTDPWGNRYCYFNIEDAPNKGKGKMRKDHFMVPVNSDYDLYSMGKDGKSVVPFTAKASRDDIVRANNGGFVGLVSEF
jgi:general secretion pathway protein G